MLIRLHLSQIQIEIGVLRLHLQLVVQLFEHFLVVWLDLGADVGLYIYDVRLLASNESMLMMQLIVDCCGPLVILDQEMVGLANVRLEAARLRDRAGIRIHGVGARRLAFLSLLSVDRRALAHHLPMRHLRLLLLQGCLLAVLQLLPMQRVRQA